MHATAIVRKYAFGGYSMPLHPFVSATMDKQHSCIAWMFRSLLGWKCGYSMGLSFCDIHLIRLLRRNGGVKVAGRKFYLIVDTLIQRSSVPPFVGGARWGRAQDSTDVLLREDYRVLPSWRCS